MEHLQVLPRVLIIDDLFGRVVANSRNEERSNLCGQYLLRDCSGDEAPAYQSQRIRTPIAEAVFFRGQSPACATVGCSVENDLQGTVDFVKAGWLGADQPRWSLVLLDLCFYTGPVTASSNAIVPGMPEGRDGDDDPRRYFGLQVLEALHESLPDLPVVILSSKPRAEVSRQFTVHGALGFLERDAEESPSLLKEYLHRHGLIADPIGQIVGRSLALLKALRLARRASLSRQNVLIRGERGTGKELLAKYVHEQAGPNRPLVVIDSGALSPDLYASTLFGHRRGAFTGATESRQGCIEEANGGDLFLDEIGNMPQSVQSGLLRVLEYRRVQPLGSNAGEAKEVDVRFISATNADLDAMASTGSFREDLHDRLRAGGQLFLPPLRDRLEDVPLLVERFVRLAEERTPNAIPRQVEPESYKLLMSYEWPGNIRELWSCILSAVSSHPDVEHLQPFHLVLRADRQASVKTQTIVEAERDPGAHISRLEELLIGLENVEFANLDARELAGGLTRFETAWARFMARYLKAGLQLTRRVTPRNPAGEFVPLPALQLITGNLDLKAWQAYDKIKALCQISHTVEREIREDEVLSEILGRANRSRRSRSE